MSTRIWDAIKKQIEAEYGGPIEKIGDAIPEGYEVEGFSDVPVDRDYLTADLVIGHARLACPRHPRLILRPRRRRRILLEETGQVRKARRGEYSSWFGAMPYYVPLEETRGSHHEIWTARELKPGETA